MSTYDYHGIITVRRHQRASCYTRKFTGFTQLICSRQQASHAASVHADMTWTYLSQNTYLPAVIII